MGNRLKFIGPEHVREVRRADLGVHEDSEEVLTWDTSNNFICDTELEDAEVMRLTSGSGGTWALVTEETSPEPDEQQLSLRDLPTVSVASESLDDESSSDEDEL